MVEKGSVVTGRDLFVIVKNENGRSSFLCDTNHSDVMAIVTNEDSEDVIHEDVIVWTDEMVASVYKTESLDEAVYKLMYLSGFEEYLNLVLSEDLCIAELGCSYSCKNLIIGSQMVDYWK